MEKSEYKPISIISFSTLIGAYMLVLSCWGNRKTASVESQDQAKLGYRTASILAISGLQFKVLNPRNHVSSIIAVATIVN